MGTSLMARGRRLRSNVRTANHRGARQVRVVGETLVVVLAALAYFLVRGLMDGKQSAATANASALIDLEGQLGLYHEPGLQSLIIDSDFLIAVANNVYIFGHWPVIAATLVWLIWQHGTAFTLYRSAMLWSGAIGLVFFLLIPMAPPRLLPDYGFVDTVTQHTEAYRLLQPPSLTNQYAAMPSLHVGWNLLMGIAITRHATTVWLRATGLVMPVVMWLATVVTANHFLLDGIVGAAVALAGLGLAACLGSARRRLVDVWYPAVYGAPVYCQLIAVSPDLDGEHGPTIARSSGDPGTGLGKAGRGNVDGGDCLRPWHDPHDTLPEGRHA